MTDQTKTIRLRGKKWILPEVVGFNPVSFISLGGFWYYDVVDFRPPKKGEYYLSGAIVEAYRAPNDLGDSFLVVKKTVKARQTSMWVPADTQIESRKAS